MTIAERAQMIVMGYAMYPLKMLWPDDLAVLYPNLMLIGRQQWELWQVALAGAGVAAVTLTAIAYAKRAPWLFVGWFWYMGTLAPVIGFVQVGRHVMADRYAYIPFIGLYMIVAWGLGSIVMRIARPLLTGCATAIAAAWVIALAVMAHRQVWVWSDSVTLFSHAIAVTRDNWMLLNNLGGVLARQGKYDEGLPLIKAATEICHDCGWVHEHYAETLALSGRLFESQRAFERALELSPTSASAHANLGVVLVRLNSNTRGLEHLRRAVELDPADVRWRRSLAVGLSLDGQRDEAVAVLEHAMREHPHMRNELQRTLEAILLGGTLQTP
jgi:Tfp pilus assembly protein PilF